MDVIRLNAGLTLERLSYTQDGLDLLIQVDEGSVQSLRVSDHFAGNGGGIDSIVADDGSSISAADISALLPGAPPSDDGIVIDNEVTGDDMDNQLQGTHGNDLIDGAGGADTLFGFAGDDRLLGGEGDDYLSGGNGSNDPNDGNDHLIGGIGNDTLFGEGGNDLMEGGLGDDHYYYKAGGGQDSIDASGGGVDGLFFLDVSADRLSFHQEGDDLLMLVDDDLQQQVRVIGHFLDAEHALGYVQPNGGYAILSSQIPGLLTALPGDTGAGGDTPVDEPALSTGFEIPDPASYDQIVIGSDSAEQLVGSGEGDYLEALAGDDQLFGLGGNDALLGGEGADYLDGGAGDDLQLAGDGDDQLGGDAGNDRLSGGLGDDIYVYRPGSGADLIDNSDGGADWLIFTDDLTADRLSYYRSGDDLIVRVDDDASQQVTVQSWYTGSSLAYIQPAGGYGISASQIESMAETLPSARSGFAAASVELGSGTAQSVSLEQSQLLPGVGKTLSAGPPIHREALHSVVNLLGMISDRTGWLHAQTVREESVPPSDRLQKSEAANPQMPVRALPPSLCEDVSAQVTVELAGLCIKPTSHSQLSLPAATLCVKSPAPIDRQYEQLVTSMAGFDASQSSEPLFSRVDRMADQTMLAVGGLN